MSFYGSIFPRIDVISLDDLAVLLAGGRNHNHASHLNELLKAFPQDDSRIIYRGDPFQASKITHKEAVKYWRLKFPSASVPTVIAEPITIENLKKTNEGLEAENLNLRNQLGALSKQKPPETEEKPAACGWVTFGAVCYLLAKYGVINGEINAFQTQGVTDLAPVPNKISSEIEALASELTKADNPDVGFKDSGRRKAIGEAMAAFNQQILKNKKSKLK